MSPEDDLQTQRVPAINDISISRGWKPISQSDDSVPLGIHNHKTNRLAAESPLLLNSSGDHHHLHSLADSENEQNHNRSTNNNEWDSGGGGGGGGGGGNDGVGAGDQKSREMKNGWKEVPQHEATEPMNGGGGNGGNGLTTRKNGNGSMVNGGGGGGSNGNGVHGNGSVVSTVTTEAAMKNGHTDKLQELDPLTGVHYSHHKEIDDDELSTCGIGACQPKWATMFSSTHTFMIVFLLAWVLQGMYFTYFVSVITTIEKLFQIKSKTIGVLMSATEIGQIGTALFLTYYAGRGHRPRWIACGMVLFAVSCFGCTIPHYLFGDQLLHANNAFYGGGSSSSISSNNNNGLLDVTSKGSLLSSSLVSLPPNISLAHLNLCRATDFNPNGSSIEKGCQTELLQEQEAHSKTTNTVLIMFFVCMLGVGIGMTAVSTLGIPFIDDNVASRESPIYIAITIGVRILGPAAGFILGSFCTRMYVDLSDPGLKTSDPKWVGAWYLGLVLISSLMILASIAMFTFPKNLKGNRIPPPMKMRAIEAAKKLEKQEDEAKPRLRDFPKTIKRQLSNDILMFRTASSVLHLLPVAGLYTFLPKYLESQFRLPAHDANMITGIGGILVMGVGIVISGVVILKFSPTARSVAAYIAFTALVYAAGMAILMFIGCSMDDFVGLRPFASDTTQPRFVPTCNFTACDCDMDKFSPICGNDGMTYYSSCHAGCEAAEIVDNKTLFSKCACIPDFVGNGSASTTTTSAYPYDATSGYCDGDCKSFILFILLFSFFVFMHSTSEVGSMLLIMRCTDPKDKAMAMGIIQFAIGLFGNVPCPIIYGAVIDSTCLVWETICGKQGACSLYDANAFRHFFFGTTSGIMVLAFVMDLVVWHKAHRIDIDPENHASDMELEKPINATATATTTTVPESVV